LVDDKQLLRDVAAGQRNVVFCVLGQIGYVAIEILGAVLKMMPIVLVGYVLALGLLVFMLVSVYKLATALGMMAILYVVLMFIPCVSILALLSISGKATKRLQGAGLKVGLLGVDPKSI
jgi:hypothetical protein